MKKCEKCVIIIVYLNLFLIWKFKLTRLLLLLDMLYHTPYTSNEHSDWESNMIKLHEFWSWDFF